MGKKPLLSELTLREKIGQTAIGYTHNDYSQLAGAKPWGGLYVSGNIKLDVFNMAEEEGDTPVPCSNWAEFTEKISAKLKIPFLPALDNTAGIKAAFYELSRLADPVSIGSADSEELAYESGVCKALQAKCVGARWWWGPEIDLPHRNCSIFHGRHFSSDPDKLVKLAIAAMKGALDNGVIPTAKHFPGADDMEYRDPHISPTNINFSYEDWMKNQGRIFQIMIDAGVPSIMISHSGFPAVDDSVLNGNYRPCTLSYKVITELLKGKMGFKGVVITDGISMRSAVTAMDDDMEKVYIEAFKAGNDVILGCEDYYIDLIEKAVLDGVISMERVDDACRRVIDMKDKIGMFDDNFKHSIGDIEAVNQYAHEVNKKIAEKAISLVCDKHKLLPVKQDKIKKVAIICACERDDVYNTLTCMKESFEKRGAAVHMQRVLESRDMTRQLAKENDLLVYVGHLSGQNEFHGAERASFYYALLEGEEKSIGVGIGHPFMYYDYYSSFKTFINAYTFADETQEAVVAAIFGEIPFQGGEPFPLVPEYIQNYNKF